MTADEIGAAFDRWAERGLAAYPTIGDGGPERVYARGAELRELLEDAYRAGWRRDGAESAARGAD